jgi:hypothetical protein
MVVPNPALEPSEDAADLLRLRLQFGERIVIKVADIQCDNQVRLQLRAGSLRDVKKVCELKGPVAVEAFRKIRHDGDSGSAHLVPESPVFCKHALT